MAKWNFDFNTWLDDAFNEIDIHFNPDGKEIFDAFNDAGYSDLAEAWYNWCSDGGEGWPNECNV